ncbi:hypothetical protein PI125_g24598 [Phytophthora idaei]|nr:hypothetical protein PI125_g24598 [Phytophthora idaei]
MSAAARRLLPLLVVVLTQHTCDIARENLRPKGYFAQITTPPIAVDNDTYVGFGVLQKPVDVCLRALQPFCDGIITQTTVEDSF